MIVGGRCSSCTDWYQCDLSGGCLRQFIRGYVPVAVTWEDDLVKTKERIVELETLHPARCNRGACTGTIKPNGRCIRCNQEPLKESK